MHKFFLTAAALIAAAGAQAITVSSQFGAPDPGARANADLVFDFNQATPELTGNFSLVTGTLSGAYAAPAGDLTQYAVVPMAGQPRGVADLSLAGFGDAISEFSLYWGSIDLFNTIEFYDGLNLIGSVTGADIPPANGDQTASVTNRRVNIRFDSGQTLTNARFISDGVAFEFDDVAISAFGNGTGTAVPEPATWGLMIAGFAMVGAAARRRTTRIASVAA